MNAEPIGLKQKCAVICLIASQGGHLQQLIRFAPVYTKYDHFLISTVEPEDESPWHGIARQYRIRDINEGRWLRNPVRFIMAFIQTMIFLLKLKPDLIVSTGAGIAVPAFILAKLLGIPSIFIESYARIKGLSKAGRVCYRFASRFLVQHESLQQHYSSSI